MPDLASKNVDDGDALAVETLVLVGALDDNRTVDLHTSIKPPTLHIIPDGRLTLVHLGFENPTYTHGTGGSTDLATNRTTEGFERLERLGGIDHNNAVVDIDASQEPDTSRMQHDPRRGTPIAGCGFTAKQHAGATGTTEPKTRSHGREDGEAQSALDYLGRDLLQNTLFALGPVDFTI